MVATLKAGLIFSAWDFSAF